MRWTEIISEGFIDGQPVAGADLPAQLQHIGAPSAFYHSTPTVNLPVIRKNGLEARAGSRRKALFGEYPNRVYLTTSQGMTRQLQRDHAKEGAGHAYSIIKIDPRHFAPETRLFHDPEDKASFYVEISIPPAAIVAVEDASADLNTQYYQAAAHALTQLGLKFSGADDFAVSDDAILFYVDDPVSEVQLAQINRIVSAYKNPAFGPIEIQDVDETGTQLVGYLLNGADDGAW